MNTPNPELLEATSKGSTMDSKMTTDHPGNSVSEAAEHVVTDVALELRAIVKSYRRGSNSSVAVAGVDLKIRRGELVVLLGPSGCGKTTILRCVAGLTDPTSGQIEIERKSMFDSAQGLNLPPEKRQLGMVFQNYALWPHMTVRQNIAYPLKAQRKQLALREEWEVAAARTVGCENLLDRYPGELSGGQAQRVALARGLVARPNLLLFDEPLSNLDAKLRIDLRDEIRRLHQELKFTGLYVTHDQEEALVLADRIIILRDGRIEQSGSPKEVFEEPATAWVAGFLGASNQADLEWVDTSGNAILSGAVAVYNGMRPHETTSSVRCRPEDIEITAMGMKKLGADSGELRTRGVIEDIRYRGVLNEFAVRIGTTTWTARTPAGRVSQDLTVGMDCEVSVPRDRVFFYPADPHTAAIPESSATARSA